jgi:hypothetical protein
MYANRAIYLTSAHYAANGNSFSGTYPGFTSYQYSNGGALASTTLQGAQMTNLQCGTAYTVAGQSSPDNSTWYTTPVTTFTTVACPASPVHPTHPQAVTNISTLPTITGTNYEVTGTASATTCVSLQTCLQTAKPGDGIYWPHGSGNALNITSTIQNISVPSNAIPVSISGNVLTETALAADGSSFASYSNGQQFRIGGLQYEAAPVPMQSGVTYSTINMSIPSGCQFATPITCTTEVSQDGTNVLTLTSTGSGTNYIVPWPETCSTGYVLIHTDDDNNLPPFGVRLDPVAYGPYMSYIQDQSISQYIALFGLNACYWWEGIAWTLQPKWIAGETDPLVYGGFVSSFAESDHIIWDRNWFHLSPLDRLNYTGDFAGSNIAVIGTVLDNQQWWKPQVTTAGGNPIPPTCTTSTCTWPASSTVYSFPTTNDAYDSCTVPANASVTVSGGTSGSPLNYILYFTHDPCVFTAAPQTGLTVSFSGFGSVTTQALSGSASLAWPVDGNGIITVLLVGNGTQNGSNPMPYAYYANGSCGANNGNPGQCGVAPLSYPNGTSVEGANGMHLQPGPGPFLFYNSNFNGSGIPGPWEDEHTPGNGLFPSLTTSINATIKRSTIQTEADQIPSSPTFNGAYGGMRNCTEFKTGQYILFTGNIIGPCIGVFADGECLLALTYWGNGGSSSPTNYLNPQNTSDIEASYNTCMTSDAFGIGWGNTNYSGFYLPQPLNRIWIHDNLFFINASLYQTGAANTGQSFSGQGYQFSLQETNNVDIEHNEAVLQAGPTPTSINLIQQPFGDFTAKNNIFTYASGTGYGFAGLFYSNGDNFSNGNAPASPDYNEYTPVNLLPNLNNVTFGPNLWIPTCSNSQTGAPYCTTEYTSGNVTSLAANYGTCAGTSVLSCTISGGPANIFLNQGSVASNLTYLHWIASPAAWINPLTTGTPNALNYALTYLSPYISGGAFKASDGLDMGPNIQALWSQQGVVQNVHVIPGTNAKVVFQAPDSFVCLVDYAANNNFLTGAVGRSTVSQATPSVTAAEYGTVQVATLGIVHGYFRINCAAQQPTGSF